ncbi:MAG: hypothetical protein ICV84_10620 [Flavisolibacter sp.]|nr:hypothetical protein [Flavisolibacter sp.]
MLLLHPLHLHLKAVYFFLVEDDEKNDTYHQYHHCQCTEINKYWNPTCLSYNLQ